MVARRGSEADALIRLVSYLQGFKYYEKPHHTTLADICRSIIPDLTRMSSYLINLPVSDEHDLYHLLDFYNTDF